MEGLFSFLLSKLKINWINIAAEGLIFCENVLTLHHLHPRRTGTCGFYYSVFCGTTTAWNLLRLT